MGPKRRRREHFQSGEFVYVESLKKYGTVLIKFPDDLYQVRLSNGTVSNFKPQLLQPVDIETMNDADEETRQDGVNAIARFVGLPVSPHYASNGESNDSIGLLDPDYTPPVPTYAPPEMLDSSSTSSRPSPGRSLPVPSPEPSFDWSAIGKSITSFWQNIKTGFVPREHPRTRMLVLGASPLNFWDEGHLSPLVQSPRTPEMQKLNLQAEQRMIEAVATEAGSPVEIQFDYLDAVKLKEAMWDPPDVLQLTGHGVSDAHTGTKYLALERQDGSTHLLTPEQLRPLVEDRDVLPEVVVLCACHSERFGRIFADAGVPHVVCCKGRILDSSLMSFERGFYSLLLKGSSVHEAHAEGVRFVKMDCDCERHPTSLTSQHQECSPLLCVEAEKVLLLPSAEPHDEAVVDSDCEEMAELPALINRASGGHCSLPAGIQPFVGRAHEMQRLISKLVTPDARCVLLTGEELIGKSAVAIQAAHYLRSRGIFAQINYVDLSEHDSISSALRREGDEEAPSQAQVARRLQNEHCLIFVDNCTKDTPAEVLKELVFLVKNTYRAKFLVTSRELLDFESTDGMDVTHLPAVGPLDIREASELVRKLFPMLERDVRAFMNVLEYSRLHPQKLRKMVVQIRRNAQEQQRRSLLTSRNNIQRHSSAPERTRRNSIDRAELARLQPRLPTRRSFHMRKRSRSLDRIVAHL